MKRVNVHLTEQQLEALRRLRDTTGISVAEHVRRALDFYIKESGKTRSVEMGDRIR